MKHTIFTRIIAWILTVVMAVPMLACIVPEASAAGYINGEFLEKDYKRKGSYGSIFQFDKVLKDSYGFTLYFTLDKITKGKLDYDKHLFEVCVKDTSDEWIVAELFYLQEGDLGRELEINVSLLNPRDITQMAILYRGDKSVSYEYSVLLEDKCYSFGDAGIPGEWATKQYSRSNRNTYPFVLDSVLYDCTGFTLHYDLVEVLEGILDYKTKYEVCVKDTAGKWTCVSTFKLRDDYMPVDITWDKAIDVTQVAVLPVVNEKHSYNYYFSISDVLDRDTVKTQKPETAPKTEKTPAAKKTDKEPVATSGGYLSGSWSDTPFKRSGRSSTPFVFDTPLTKCKGFTLDYSVQGVTEGSMKDSCKFQIFYCTSDGTWTKSKEFTVEDGFASVDVTLKKATTVTKVAVHCMNAGYFSFQYSMGVRDPVF